MEEIAGREGGGRGVGQEKTKGSWKIQWCILSGRAHLKDRPLLRLGGIHSVLSLYHVVGRQERIQLFRLLNLSHLHIALAPWFWASWLLLGNGKGSFYSGYLFCSLPWCSLDALIILWSKLLSGKQCSWLTFWCHGHSAGLRGKKSRILISSFEMWCWKKIIQISWTIKNINTF